MSEQNPTRLEEIRKIHTEYHLFYRMLGLGVFVLIGAIAGALIHNDYLALLLIQAISVIIIIFVLDTLQQRREEQRREADLQAQLIRQAGSPIQLIFEYGWLAGEGKYGHTKALLKGANLRNTNLRGQNLSSADLSSANLGYADLRETTLVNMNLSGANLASTKLEEAFANQSDLSRTLIHRAKMQNATFKYSNFTLAHLQLTNLTGTNLTGSNFTSANLCNTRLCGANLTGANLTDAFLGYTVIYDENTILPDGTHWSPERDLAEFGAETREIINEEDVEDETGEFLYRIHHFADGTQRRYKMFVGWLD